MNNEELSALLENYLKGTCTPEEYSLINEWYAHYESAAGFTDALSTTGKNHLGERLSAEIYAKIAGRQSIVETTHKRFYPGWLFWSAAAAVVIVLIRLLFINQPRVGNENQLLRMTNNTQKIYRQVLPDQSVVYLNPKASLSYPRVFGKGSRSVSMNGDCFFEITKNPSRPFIIQSSRMVTKVWGTSFRIDDQIERTAANVLVLTGKVSVSKRVLNEDKSGKGSAINTVMLYPEQRASVNGKQMLRKETQVDLSPLRRFEHTDLSFDSKPLSEIARVLSERFSVRIRLTEEKLGGELMSANMNDLNLPEILDILKASMRLDYQINGNTIYLKSAIPY